MSNKLKVWSSSLLTFALTFLVFFHPITDFSQDLGRHLKLGEIILHQAQSCAWLCNPVPKTNLFSYTYPTFPFINHHWLSEVIFYLLFRTFGITGFAVFLIAVASLAVTLLFIFVAKRTNFFTAYVALLLYLSILLERTGLRPEIFSFFFISLFMVILYRYRESVIPDGDPGSIHLDSRLRGNDKKKILGFTFYVLRSSWWLFLLPILELLWVNMHIYFPVGPLLIFLFLIDEIYCSSVALAKSRTLKQTSRFVFQTLSKHTYQILRTKIFLLSFILLLSCIATLFNPNGLSGALYPLHIFSNYGYTIEENQSLSFLYNYGLWYPWFSSILVACGAFLTLLFIYRRKTSLIDWLLCVVFAIGAFSAVRNFSLFVFATFIPFVYLLNHAISQCISVIPGVDPGSIHPEQSRGMDSRLSARGGLTRGNDKEKSYANRKRKIVAATLCILGTIFLLYLSLSSYGFGLGVVPSAEKGADFFIQNHLKGPIFNNFDIGSYLDYRLYPKEQVFVDGRPEAYPVDFFQKTYIPMQENPALFATVATQYHFTTIFFAYTDSTPWAQTFIGTIIQDQSWKLVYLDSTVFILVKNSPENQQSINRFLITESSTKTIINRITTEKELLQLASFFQSAQWLTAFAQTLQKVVSINPKNCQALGILANASPLLYQQQFLANCR